MTEREKMLAGRPYDTRDPELLGMYHNAKRLLDEYNTLPSTESERKAQILVELLEHAGEGVWIEKTFSCDYGKHISIGKNTFINYNCVFIDDNRIRIGENVLIAPAVQIYTASHPVDWRERLRTRPDGSACYTTHTAPVTIGDGVWIGGGAVICPGVTIGDRSVIGAGSVVTKSIPADSVAYGNPCRVVRTL